MQTNPVSGHVHVVGAGLAGLSAATVLAEQGRRVTLYETALQAGGRCRSYADSVMGRHIDNGNHLFLSGNRAINEYVRRIGTTGKVAGPTNAIFPFLDLKTNQRWVVDAGSGLLPWPLLFSKNRPPASSFWDFLAARRILSARSNDTIEAMLSDQRPMFAALWEPLAVAVLNTPVKTASAALLGTVLRQAFSGGAKTCRPRMVSTSLSDVFVTPALQFLREWGGDVQFNAKLTGLEFGNNQVTSLIIAGDSIPVGTADQVILAIPPWGLNAVLPDIQTPDEHRGIINGHFVLPQKSNELTFIGLLNGVSHWVFVRDDVASVTISGVDGSEYGHAEELAQELWSEICTALNMKGVPMGAHRIITEKRATISHTVRNCARRPSSQTVWPNVMLAGDWTDTGLPATIEGAIQSGRNAATLADAHAASLAATT